jgi:MFS transporter, DHA1 family, multidrug resistance protein
MLFISLSCIGLCNPNANALALAPFSRNIGSAASLLNFIQIGIASLASSGVGLLNAKEISPIVALMAITCTIALVILLIGRRAIAEEVAATDGSAAVGH